DAHRILGTKDLQVHDTCGTGDGVLDVGHDVVRQVASGHAAVGGNHTEHHEEVTHGLGHPDALLLHFLRQQRRGQLQLVLHLDLGNVRVGALVRGHGDRHAAVGVTLRGHVTEAVDAVHLLFDDLHHGVLHRLRGCTRVADLDTNGRRGDAGVLVDGQAKNGEAACEHDHQGDDPGKNGSIDKESGHGVVILGSALLGLWLGGGYVASRHRVDLSAWSDELQAFGNQAITI